MDVWNVARAVFRGPKTARFRVHHGAQQKHYVEWKYKMLQGLVAGSPREITRYDRKRGLYETSWYFHTTSRKELSLLHNWFYPGGGRKQLPKYLESVLTPPMLAVWYMDDGNYTGTSCTLNTHSLSLGEQQRVMKMLKKLCGISCTLVKDRHQYKINIRKKYVSAFMNVVAPHIIVPMSYKIAYPRNDLLSQSGVAAAETSLVQLTRQL